jgi:predicted nucleotidyltransferase
MGNILMKIINEPLEHKYNCLFLPGLPGQIKQLSVFDDITATGGKIHWLQYTGTYENRGGSEFTLESSTSDVLAALEGLNKENLPIVIIAYSYSTVLIQRIDFSHYKSILAMALFSPIKGLDIRNIGEDFLNTIHTLSQSGVIDADEKHWQDDILKHSFPDYDNVLKKLSQYDFPVMITYSLNDDVIKADELSRYITEFRLDNPYNKLLVFEWLNGHHRLDSYYNVKIGNYFRALEIELDLMKILDDHIFIYFWGSSLNYNYSGEGSDIDLLVFYNGYIHKYKELNNYVDTYNSKHDILFDLSINEKSDLMSKKIFRYNRGPVAIHELQYAYFPLRPATDMIELDWNDIVNDAYGASVILCGESKKILSKCSMSSDRVKKIIKYSITVFTYLQYIKGIRNLELNNVEKYLNATDSYYPNVMRSIELKKYNYAGMTIDDLYDAVKGIDMIIEEEERLIAVHSK